MDKVAHAEVLTMEERECGIKLGGVLHAAYHGHRGEDLDKYAQFFDIGAIGSGAARTIMALSLVTGVPAGILWHSINKEIGRRTNKEEDLKKRIDYYRNASSNLEGEMARQGITV